MTINSIKLKESTFPQVYKWVKSITLLSKKKKKKRLLRDVVPLLDLYSSYEEQVWPKKLVDWLAKILSSRPKYSKRWTYKISPDTLYFILERIAINLFVLSDILNFSSNFRENIQHTDIWLIRFCQIFWWWRRPAWWKSSRYV